MSKRIKLDKEKFAIVDDDDYEALNVLSWRVMKNRDKFYAVTKFNRDDLTRMHRFILGVKNDDDRQVDHIDRDGLNNTRLNLRLCDNSSNMANRGKCKNKKTSIYKGVSWSKMMNKWWARIQKNKVGIGIGFFDFEEDAALAYNEMALELHGEFAVLNIISA